jgi:hypothetical protein
MRPNKNEYVEYYDRYISLIKGDDIHKVLVAQSLETQQVLNSFSESMGNYSYEPGKWTIKEVVGHLIDCERVFAYRAMCIARGEKKSLPGFEQDDYVKFGNFNERELFDLNYEFRLLRESNILLEKGFNDEVMQRRGFANNGEFTVLALFYIIAGHEKHHMNILLERYKKNYASRKL